MSVNTANTARRLSWKPTRCSTSIRLILALVVSISYSFVCIDAGRTGIWFIVIFNTGYPINGNPVLSCNCTIVCFSGTKYTFSANCRHRVAIYFHGVCTQHTGTLRTACGLPPCSCFNGASCDTETGTCLCSKGYQGDNCNTTCPEGTHGFKCEKNCTCPINSVCSPIDGSCSCKYEYKYNGTHCECHPKNSIPGCEACNCSQWGFCDLITGKCMCPQERYTGQSCRKLQCGDKTYVLGCQGNCQCQYNGTCYEIDGSCDCLPGWTGRSCNYSCPDGYYGNNCQSNCTCENSKSCDPVTGKCICLPGWTGKNCSTVCPDNDVSSTGLGHDLSPNIIALISAFAFVLLVYA